MNFNKSNPNIGDNERFDQYISNISQNEKFKRLLEVEGRNRYKNGKFNKLSPEDKSAVIDTISQNIFKCLKDHEHDQLAFNQNIDIVVQAPTVRSGIKKIVSSLFYKAKNFNPTIENKTSVHSNFQHFQPQPSNFQNLSFQNLGFMPSQQIASFPHFQPQPSNFQMGYYLSPQDAQNQLIDSVPNIQAPEMLETLGNNSLYQYLEKKTIESLEAIDKSCPNSTDLSLYNYKFEHDLSFFEEYLNSLMTKTKFLPGKGNISKERWIENCRSMICFLKGNIEIEEYISQVYKNKDTKAEGNSEKNARKPLPAYSNRESIEILRSIFGKNDNSFKSNLISTLCSSSFVGFSENPLDILQEINVKCKLFSWRYPDGIGQLFLSKLPGEDRHDYYFFVVESSIFRWSDEKHRAKDNTLNDDSKCMITPYKMGLNGELILQADDRMKKAFGDALYIPENKIKKLEDLDKEFTQKHYDIARDENFGSLKKDLFSQETKVSVMPKLNWPVHNQDRFKGEFPLDILPDPVGDDFNFNFEFPLH